MSSSRTLTPSSFPGDDGTASAVVRERLAAAEDGTAGSYLQAVVALGTERLLVPVVATVTRTTATPVGLASDKQAEMAVVSLQFADGRRAALAFTGLDSLTTWQAGARPVPVTVDVIAASAVADGATAVVVDIAGPHPLVLEGEVLRQLAAGHRLVRSGTGDFGWLQPGAGPRW